MEIVNVDDSLSSLSDLSEEEELQLQVQLRRRKLIAAYLGLSILERKKRKPRSEWVRKWIHRRLEGMGTLHMHQNELRTEDPTSHDNYCRMTEAVFEELLGRIEHRIRRKDTVMRQAITPRERLTVTLRFLATGNEFKDLQYAVRMPHNTLSVVVADTMKAIIAELQEECIKCPNTTEGWERVEEQFRVLWNFPHCIGALDGKHINFRPPRKMGSYYRNYKGHDSIILLALVDARCRFQFVDIGKNGRANDASVYRDSLLAEALTRGTLNLPEPCPLPGDPSNVPMPYVVTADDAFPLTTYMLKPYPHRGLTHSERVFNYRLSRARRIVENSFGILANRFRILLKTISLSVEKVEMITMVCCILHNFILSRTPVALGIGSTSTECDVDQVDCSLRNISHQGMSNPPRSAKVVRDHFMNYFSSVGRVEWQDERVRLGQY